MLAEGGEKNSAVSSLSSCSSLFAPSPRYPILHGQGFRSSRQLKQKTNGCAPVSRNWREPHFSRREWNKVDRVNSPPPDCVRLRGASFFVFFLFASPPVITRGGLPAGPSLRTIGEFPLSPLFPLACGALCGYLCLFISGVWSRSALSSQIHFHFLLPFAQKKTIRR